MADENVNPDEGTEEQEEKQTVTAEQFEELKNQLNETKKQLEETRKAQSGSDRTVAELREEIKKKEQALSNVEKTAEQKYEERLAEMEKKIHETERERTLASQRSVAVELLNNEGLRAPKYLDRLIGEDEEATKALISEYIEDKKATKLEERQEYAKGNGRKVNSGDGSKYSGMSYKDMANLPAEEFRQIPSDVVDKAIEAELKK